MMQLQQFEHDIHGGDKIEILKCWRLHLGSSEILKIVMNSVEDRVEATSHTSKLIEEKVLFYRNEFRNWRNRDAPSCWKNFLNYLIRFYNAIFYAIRPLMGASALYFDIFKDITFAALIYVTLYDMSGGQLHDGDKYLFETTLVVIFIFAIVLVQVSRNHFWQ